MISKKGGCEKTLIRFFTAFLLSDSGRWPLVVHTSVVQEGWRAVILVQCHGRWLLVFVEGSRNQWNQLQSPEDKKEGFQSPWFYSAYNDCPNVEGSRD